MIALSVEMIRIGKQMETERRELEKMVQSGMEFKSPEIRAALECYLREKAAWEDAERVYLALRDSE